MTNYAIAKLAACVRRLVAAGYKQDKAVLVVYATWALSPEDTVRLNEQLAA